MKDDQELDSGMEEEKPRQNMVPEEALKRRLAEQTRKHEKALREQEERLMREYAERVNKNSYSGISQQAANNVISSDAYSQGNPYNSGGQGGGYIREEDLPSILAKADEYRRQGEEEERRKQKIGQENQANTENMERARKSIKNEVQNNPEFEDQIIKHGDTNTLNDIETALYDIGLHSQHVPKVIKNLFGSEDNLSKFKDPNSRLIDKKQILLDILLQNAQDNVSNSLPHSGGQFAIKGGSQVKKDPAKMNSSEYRTYASEKGLYTPRRK